MLVDIKDKTYWIEPMQVALNILGLIVLIASIFDGIPAIIVAMLIFILDELKHPYPILTEVEEGPPSDDDIQPQH